MTKDQYEKIKVNCAMKGFNSLSAYLRYIALDQDYVLHQKIMEIHQHLLPETSNRKYKNNSGISARL